MTEEDSEPRYRIKCRLCKLDHEAIIETKYDYVLGANDSSPVRVSIDLAYLCPIEKKKGVVTFSFETRKSMRLKYAIIKEVKEWQ
jgi:hypothetical protein